MTARKFMCLSKALFACVVLVLLCPLVVPGVIFASRDMAAEPGDSNFDTWILLQNPGEETATANVQFMTEAGKTTEKAVGLGPRSRTTLFANDYVNNASFSTSVQSDEKIIAERSEYFNYKGRLDGGHAKPGIVLPSREWYFAEGYTGPGFEEWLLVQNPNGRQVRLDVQFMKEDGSTTSQSYTIQPLSRLTVEVNSVPGMGETQVSAFLSSNLPVTAERTMYFLYDGRIAGGDVVPGARAPGNDWLFAEGYTGEGFDTYLLLMNPNDIAVTAKVYMKTCST